MNRLSIILLTAAAFSAGAGQLLFKIGAQDRQQLVDFINPPVIAGILFYGAGTVIWIYVLSFEKLVNVYAFTALTFVLVYLGGVVLIGEKITPVGAMGVLLILAGLLLMTKYNA